MNPKIVIAIAITLLLSINVVEASQWKGNQEIGLSQWQQSGLVDGVYVERPVNVPYKIDYSIEPVYVSMKTTIEKGNIWTIVEKDLYKNIVNVYQNFADNPSVHYKTNINNVRLDLITW